MDLDVIKSNSPFNEQLNTFIDESKNSSVKLNEQYVTRTIRKAVIVFDAAETVEDKLRAVMAVSALSALNLITNKSLIVSTLRFIESKMRI